MGSAATGVTLGAASAARGASSIEVRAARRLATEWVETNRERWPGLRASHLVGGITALADDAPFPAYKDVDVHLVVEDGSPALQGEGPFPPIVEEAYQGLLIEAGIKPLAEYWSAEAALRMMGMDTADARAARWERAMALHDTCFALADDIVARHPAVVA